MANIDPLIDVARTLYVLGAPDATHIHLCVYHARFPLAQRSAIEAMLDAAFNRRDVAAVWQQPEIRRALDAFPEHDQLFVVLASPVCEVGRDWDADWAVAEPSSMRSLIQLAGRVQRHRREPGEAPNVLVFDINLKHFEHHGSREPVFIRPGFEKATPDDRFLLVNHSLHLLLAEDEYRRLDAIPRIQPRPAGELQPRQRWVDLEQARIRASALPQARPAAATQSRRAATSGSELGRDQAAPAWQYPQTALTGVLPQQQPFREDNVRDVTLAWLPDEDEETLTLHRVENDPAQRGRKLYVAAEEMRHDIALQCGSGIGPWGEFDLFTLLAQHAEAWDCSLAAAARKVGSVEVPRSDQGWRWHPLLGFTRQG